MFWQDHKLNSNYNIFHTYIYIKQTHLLRRQKIAHNSRKGNKEPLRNGKHNSILTKLFLKPLIVGVTYAANITVLIISFY
jgi:hypothetical protein